MRARYKIGRKQTTRFTLYRPNFQIYNMEWVFHLTDKDANPSVPHGHSLDNKYRLKIWDGKVYRKQGGKLKYKGKVVKGEMLRLYKSEEFQSFVQKARSLYREQHKMCPLLVPFSAKEATSPTIRVSHSPIEVNTPKEFRIKLKVHFRPPEESYVVEVCPPL